MTECEQMFVLSDLGTSWKLVNINQIWFPSWLNDAAFQFTYGETCIIGLKFPANGQIMLSNHHCKEENTQIYAYSHTVYSHTEMDEAWGIWVLPLVY